MFLLHLEILAQRLQYTYITYLLSDILCTGGTYVHR